MKRLSTDSKHFDILRQFAQFARARGHPISDDMQAEQFSPFMSEILNQHRSSPIMLHGFRIQSMFAYLAACLGGCKIITEEDAGDLFADSSSIKRPDFRLLTHTGLEVFVEVKNFNPSDPSDDYSMRRDYAQSISEYADAFSIPLLFAIYWRTCRMWTLTPLSAFTHGENGYSISIGEALKNDYKAVLGDCMIGIPKPLALRLITDASKPRSVDKEGRVKFTVGEAAFFAAGRKIVDRFEERLAWFFLWYSSWEDLRQVPCVENGELISIDLEGLKEDPNPQELFQILGPLSQLITRQYDCLTVGEGTVRHLSPMVEPEKLGVRIPRDFRGDILGIWRFEVQPATVCADFVGHMPGSRKNSS